MSYANYVSFVYCPVGYMQICQFLYAGTPYYTFKHKNFGLLNSPVLLCWQLDYETLCSLRFFMANTQ